MTKFENVLYEMLDEYGSDPDRMKDCMIEKYGKAIRKSIVGEVDIVAIQSMFMHSTHGETPNNLYDYWAELDRAHLKGIGDTLKAIGGE